MTAPIRSVDSSAQALTPDTLVEVADKNGVFWSGSLAAFAQSRGVQVRDVARELVAGPVQFGRDAEFAVRVAPEQL